MKKYHWLLALLLLARSTFALPTNCLPDSLSEHPENVLSCFLQKPSATAPFLRLLTSEKENGVTLYRYRLISQFWPDKSLSQSGIDWQHDLLLYVPDQVRHSCSSSDLI